MANYLGQGWSALMAIAFLPLYVQALGLESYGLIGFFSIMQSVLSVFDLGVTPTLTREAARAIGGARTAQSLRNLVRSFEIIGVAVAIVLLLALWAGAGALAENWVRAGALSHVTIADSIAIMGLVFSARLFEGIYRGLLVGLDRQVAYNIFNACITTARYGGALFVLRHMATIEAFFVWQAVTSIISMALLMAAAYSCLPTAEHRARPSADALRSVWRFSAGMTFITGISIMIANVDKLILSRMIALDQFGKYALASVAAGVLYTLAVPIAQSVYPRMVGQLSNGDALGLFRSYRAIGQLTAVLVGPAAFHLAFFSTEILYVWSGNQALSEAVAPILSLLALAAFANCLGYLGHTLLLARGLTHGLIAVNSAALAFACVALPWAADRYGLYGAAFAWFAAAALQAMATLACALRGFSAHERSQWLVRDLSQPLMGAMFATCLAYCCRPDADTGRIGHAFFFAATASFSIMFATVLVPDLRIRLKAFFKGRNDPV